MIEKATAELEPYEFPFFANCTNGNFMIKLSLLKYFVGYHWPLSWMKVYFAT